MPLQLTLIGWIPAAIWAVYALGQYKTDQKLREAGISALRSMVGTRLLRR